MSPIDDDAVARSGTGLLLALVVLAAIAAIGWFLATHGSGKP